MAKFTLENADTTQTDSSDTSGDYNSNKEGNKRVMCQRLKVRTVIHVGGICRIFQCCGQTRILQKSESFFNASGKNKGISLNDAIEPGPKLQNELQDVLTRFRSKSVAVICDIQEMYLQIGIPYTDFLWRSKPEQSPEVFEFNRLVFGVNTSPFLAQYIARHNASKYSHEFPVASETVMKSTYMDDSMDSVSTAEQGIELYHDLSELWKRAGMYARKWLSNSETVLQHIPKQDRAKEVDLSDGELPSIKTLGVWWIADRDIFTFKFNTVDENIVLTKRSFLKKISTIYDPLGFLVPFTVWAKL